MFSPISVDLRIVKIFSQNGGTLTQNPCSDTFCVVAERINVRVKNIIR